MNTIKSVSLKTIRNIGLGVSFATLCVSGYSSENNTGQNEKPNFVFIMVDDLGWKDVGFMGSNYYETPNIDKLSRQGMVFTNAYANAPNCAPTRACLMTGQYTPRHGIYTVNNPNRGESRFRKLIPIPNTTILDSSFVTLAETMRSAGYRTGMMGKWHLGEGEETGPEGQGFDVNIGGHHKGHPSTYFSPYKNEFIEDGPYGEYLTDRMTDEAIKFIEESKDGPFFLYLPYYAVHTPIQPKPEVKKKYEGKPADGKQNNPAYAAMVETVDAGVGIIMNKLDELMLTENTVVIFFSDNGGVGGITDMSPLRGSKGMLYEGGIREPMIVRWTGKVKPGTRCDIPVIGVDFYPTFMEIAGIKKPKDLILDGKNILPLFTGKKKFRKREIFWHFPAYLQANKRFLSGLIWRTTPVSVIRKGDWKLLEFFEDGHLELYNLEEDIGETNNLAEQMPGKVRTLYKKLLKWRVKVNAPVPTELNPEYNPEY
ncbi:MAG: sulfatase-like hydrolase/transferase [Bacteroidetes bacterium]|nr:sulfatase-like hydrolase/transferase [Bacteroidota bacterium]